MSSIPTRRINSPFLIGLFVTISFVALIGVVLWLGSSELLKKRNLYCAYFKGSVEGLEPGSAVKYLGVPVGAVNKIRVAEDGKLIEVIMQIEKNININDSIRVKSEMAGIAGGKFLQLYYPIDETMLKSHPDLSFKPPYKLIMSSPSGIDEIELAAREVLSRFSDLNVEEISDGTIKFLDASTKFFNNKRLYQIVSELEQSSERLNRILAKADESNIINNVSGASIRLFQTADSLKIFATKLNRYALSWQAPVLKYAIQ